MDNSRPLVIAFLIAAVIFAGVVGTILVRGGGLSLDRDGGAQRTASSTGSTGGPSTSDLATAEAASAPTDVVATLAPPTFDIVRVDAAGTAVLAGRGAPGATVSLLANGAPLIEAEVDSRGEWVVIVSDPLPVGAVELALLMRTQSGQELRSDQVVVVSIPETRDTRPLVVLGRPGGASEVLCPLEADNPVTRSNDGRADPWGGFWIGTMGHNLEPDAGAIYRYYQGELRRLYTPITVPNAICFSPDRRFGYFADTVKSKVWRQPLNPADGWPQGDPEVFLDFTDAGIFPDGAVCDSAGYFVNAQWGAARVARYSPGGAFDSEFPLPTDHITCPGFGGADLRRMFVTSAMQGLSEQHLDRQPEAGKTFSFEVETPGQTEHQVIL